MEDFLENEIIERLKRIERALEPKGSERPKTPIEILTEYATTYNECANDLDGNRHWKTYAEALFVVNQAIRILESYDWER